MVRTGALRRMGASPCALPSCARPARGHAGRRPRRRPRWRISTGQLRTRIRVTHRTIAMHVRRPPEIARMSAGAAAVWRRYKSGIIHRRKRIIYDVQANRTHGNAKKYGNIVSRGGGSPARAGRGPRWWRPVERRTVVAEMVVAVMWPARRRGRPGAGP